MNEELVWGPDEMLWDGSIIVFTYGTQARRRAYFQDGATRLHVEIRFIAAIDGTRRDADK
jgi:hypothetical protein